LKLYSWCVSYFRCHQVWGFERMITRWCPIRVSLMRPRWRRTCKRPECMGNISPSKRT
jgi:hypothetical protein